MPQTAPSDKSLHSLHFKMYDVLYNNNNNNKNNNNKQDTP